MSKVKNMGKRKNVEIAVIGGSGLYHMEGLTEMSEIKLKTPFGPPSDAIRVGTLHDRRVAFLARHGRDHRKSPSDINYRANIYALKSIGVKRIFSVSAVGSMKESIKPGDMVLPHQFIDRTRHRVGTFFDQGVVAHVALADPICQELSEELLKATRLAGATVHVGGTYICIEGPQFSTRAESQVYRQWGVDVIGMTNLPEAKLAREAELCYATLALVTDYDCWHESEEAVTVGAILDIMHQNVAMAKTVLSHAIQMVAPPLKCNCPFAMDHAVVTPVDRITRSARQRFGLLLERFFSVNQKTKRSR